MRRTTGRIERVTHHSGDTWNVNPIALKRIERLYCRNERATIRLRLDAGGHVLTLVPVAAILVASLRLHCIDLRLHLRYRGPQRIDCDARVAKGQELGWFEHGSTIIVFAPRGFTLCPGIETGGAGAHGPAADAPAATRACHARSAASTSPASAAEAPMPHIDLIYFNAGGGHRAAAEALREVMDSRRLALARAPAQPVRAARPAGPVPPPHRHARPRTTTTAAWHAAGRFGLAQELKLLQAAIRLAHPQLVQRLQQHWRQAAPDLAVSLVPNFNLALAHSLQAAAARHALRHRAHRPGRPPAALLDRTRRWPACGLRHRSRAAAGARGRAWTSATCTAAPA